MINTRTRRNGNMKYLISSSQNRLHNLSRLQSHLRPCATTNIELYQFFYMYRFYLIFAYSFWQLVEILDHKYGIPHEVAADSASTFLRAFRARPDDESYAIDEWPTHLWRNSLPKNYRHIAKNVATEWLKLRFQYLALTPDVIHLLETLREDYLLGLITNGPSRAQWQKIERLGLRKYFDCVLVSGDLPWEKPDQNIFLEACKLLNVEARACIMVGDKLETDIKGGKEAELGGTVWIPLRYDEMDSDLPDFKIQKVTELPEVLPNSPKLKKKTAQQCMC